MKMPLQNRMLPNGELSAEDWRGTMMGNRGGRIHDPDTQTLLKRRSASRRWICCVLEFKNRQRKVMGGGYTEVFFLDEVSALAAGHRPCFECRRNHAVEFQSAWRKAFHLEDKPGADMMDMRLHQERTSEKPIITGNELIKLPDGAMIRFDEKCYALKHGALLQWTGSGYLPAGGTPDSAIEVLTPISIISVLANGYQPQFHTTADIPEQ